MGRGKPGRLYKLTDGRLGVGYNKEQALVKDGCAFLRLVDEQFKPIKACTGSGAWATVIRDLKDIEFLGMVD